MTSGTKIKICGLSRPCDIQYVNEAKPDYCGFIVNFPKSHRNVVPDTVRALVKDLDPAITPVGVFVNQPAADVAALLEDGTIRVAQLHGSEDEDYISSLRALAPGKTIWKAFKVRTPEDVAAANASSADLVLLDNGAGTGETFDWSLTALAQRPYLLAGGLTPQNLPQAIQGAHPYGVDLSSGVETDKVKDRAKVLAAVAAVRNAEN
jgi:phosphoribosylanthranilate isomerase